MGCHDRGTSKSEPTRCWPCQSLKYSSNGYKALIFVMLHQSILVTFFFFFLFGLDKLFFFFFGLDRRISCAHTLKMDPNLSTMNTSGDFEGWLFALICWLFTDEILAVSSVTGSTNGLSRSGNIKEGQLRQTRSTSMDPFTTLKERYARSFESRRYPQHAHTAG